MNAMTDPVTLLNTLVTAFRELVTSDEDKYVDVDGVMRPTMSKIAAQFAANHGVQPSVEAGLAVAEEGGVFAVPGDDDVYLTLYRKIDGVAEQIAQAPSLDTIQSLVKQIEGLFPDAGLHVGSFVDPDGVVYSLAIVDEPTQSLIAGFRRDGGIYLAGMDGAPSQKSAIKDQQGGELCSFENGVLTLFGLRIRVDSAAALINIEDKRTGRSLFRISNRGRVTMPGYVESAPQESAIRAPAIDHRAQHLVDVNHQFLYGQSLSTSIFATSPPISTTQPYNNICLGDRPYAAPGREDTYDGSAFVPLIEQRKETPTSGVVNEMCRRFVAAYGIEPPVMLGSTLGEPGSTLKEISPAEFGGSDSTYEHAMQYLRDAKAICDAQGLTYAVSMLHWFQGEQDTDTSRAIYAEDLARLKQRFDQDIMRLTGQQFRPMMGFYQVGAFRRYDSNEFGQELTLLSLAKGRDDMFMSVPVYCLPHLDDNLHLTPEGAWLMGAYHARAAFETFFTRKKWEPLWPVNIRWGSQYIDILYNPRGDLHLDDELCALAPNFGFDIWRGDDVLEDAIDAVEVVNGDTIRLSLSQPAALTDYLTCARGRPGDPAHSNSTTGPRSNVRDSHGDFDVVTSPSGTQHALHNVSVMFQYDRARGLLM